jgi:hypothetical protein
LKWKTFSCIEALIIIHFSGINRYVEVYDWLKWRGNFLRASFDSQIVGSNVCSALADAEKQQGEIKHLHVIGVSVGAFAADSCIKIFNKVSFLLCPFLTTVILKTSG